jgi:hypothetical protein
MQIILLFGGQINNKPMKKYMQIIFLLFLVACKSSHSTVRIYQKIANTGMCGIKYKFSDCGQRYIIISFVSDSIVEVVNRTSIAHSHSKLNFDNQYRYKMVELGIILVYNKIGGDKPLSKNKYIKPYNNKSFILDSNSVEFIFPNIEDDTLSFSSDFKKLQIKEFCFDKIK